MKNSPIQTLTRCQFERSNGLAIEATTIAPYPGNSTLEAQGWKFVERNSEGEIINTSNADDARKCILRGFGHRV